MSTESVESCCGYTAINQQRLTFLHQQPSSSTNFPQDIMPHKATNASASNKKTAPKTNEKGEITSWSVKSPDGKLLSILFEQDLLEDQTDGSLKKEYKQCAKYSNKMPGSAPTNLQILQNFNSTRSIVEEDNAEDEMYEDEELYEDDISHLSMNDEYSYDTFTTAYRSHAG
eukprot:6932494-Ditylum_brightwellii.AAC.1